jgi:hypothetical protein
MAKVSVSTTVRTEVGLDLRTKAQIRVALSQYLDLQREIKMLTAKQEALKTLVQEKFSDADELDALIDGASIDGIKVKLVTGVTRSLDKKRLMKKFGLSQADLDSCSPEKPSKPYVRISAPSEPESEE